MTTKKTATRSTTKKAPARKAPLAATAPGSTPAPAVTAELKQPARPAKAAAAVRDTFCLHLGQGFSLVTQQVPGGFTTVARVPSGARLEIAYWKEPSHPQHPDARLTRVTMHARVDGAALPSVLVARRDDEGRLVRLAAALELPETAKLLEYWFELETDGEQRLWDSNWGNNHWLELSTVSGPAQADTPARAEA